LGYYRSTTVVLQGYYSTTWVDKSTTGVTLFSLLGYYWGTTVVLLEFQRCDTRVLQEKHRNISGVPLGHY